MKNDFFYKITSFIVLICFVIIMGGCAKPNPTPHEVTGKYKDCAKCHKKGTEEDAPKTTHLKKKPCDECHKVEPKKEENKD